MLKTDWEFPFFIAKAREDDAMERFWNSSFHSPIVVHDGVESMSDGQYCAVSELPPYGLLNELISFQVHRGRGFVKDQKFTVT